MCCVVLLSLFVFLIFSRLATMFNKSESESEYKMTPAQRRLSEHAGYCVATGGDDKHSGIDRRNAIPSDAGGDDEHSAMGGLYNCNNKT